MRIRVITLKECGNKKGSVSMRSTDPCMRLWPHGCNGTNPTPFPHSGANESSVTSALTLVPVHLAAFGHDTKEALFDQFLLCPPPDNRTHGSRKTGLPRKRSRSRVGNTKYPVRLKRHGEMGVVMTTGEENG